MKSNPYFEFRQHRDLGDTITLYFDFLKQNFKSFLNIFISYNGIFAIVFLGISYLLVSGFMGLISISNNTFDQVQTTEDDYILYLISAGVLFVLVLIAIGTLNYSLASSYSIQYVNDKTIVEDKEKVWNRIKSNLSNIFMFMVLLFLIYGVYMILLSVVLDFIPLLGALVQYVIAFAMTSWLGISFMVLLNESKSPIQAYQEGWTLVKTNFWKCVGTNFVLGILIAILQFLLISIPGILIGVYSYLAIDTGTILTESVTTKIIYTLGVCLLLLIMTFSHCLSQFVNAILYYGSREHLYNENTREKINQIGSSE